MFPVQVSASFIPILLYITAIATIEDIRIYYTVAGAKDDRGKAQSMVNL